MTSAQALLKTWRDHIADVYARRGRSDVYQPLEVFHTCHGCGAGAGLISAGICETCQERLAEVLNDAPADAPVIVEKWREGQCRVCGFPNCSPNGCCCCNYNSASLQRSGSHVDQTACRDGKRFRWDGAGWVFDGPVIHPMHPDFEQKIEKARQACIRAGGAGGGAQFLLPERTA